ncbi:MAG: methylenetetrahydrofolate reductase [Deltaproteobacteria bacterium]|nr:methylenetetrahydrofolate reductase [Deltaproteobacteria bacterium]
MKSFKEALEAGDFVITAECGPPKGADISELKGHAKRLLGKVHALNVTDNQSSVMRAGSLAVSKVLLDMGHDPIYQLTCRDRNRLAIQSDLLSAHILGIKNVLCLTGDSISVGDHKGAKAVFDLESVQLLKLVETMNNGKDMAGNDLKGATTLFAGAVVTPEENPVEPQVKSAGKEKALDCGMDIAARQIKELKGLCDGVHVMAIGLEDKVPTILERAGF